MPPTTLSASSTVTATPSLASRYAAVSPPGPAPTTTTWSRGRSRVIGRGSVIRTHPCSIVHSARVARASLAVPPHLPAGLRCHHLLPSSLPCVGARVHCPARRRQTAPPARPHPAHSARLHRLRARPQPRHRPIRTAVPATADSPRAVFCPHARLRLRIQLALHPGAPNAFAKKRGSPP